MAKVDDCPLCNLASEEVVREWPSWTLARTKRMKGHKERLMLCYKEHVTQLDEQSVGEAYMILLNVGMKAFHYTRFWAIFEATYASVPSHWHRVISDLEPAEDTSQILKTPRLVVDNETMIVSRGNVD